jgi:hypothetical protein
VASYADKSRSYNGKVSLYFACIQAMDSVILWMSKYKRSGSMSRGFDPASNGLHEGGDNQEVHGSMKRLS